MNKIMNLKKQLTVTIDEDEWYESPRDDWENLGTLYTWEGGYSSPDRQNFSDGLEFLGSIIGEELIEKIHDKYNNNSDFFEFSSPFIEERLYLKKEDEKCQNVKSSRPLLSRSGCIS